MNKYWWLHEAPKVCTDFILLWLHYSSGADLHFSLLSEFTTVEDVDELLHFSKCYVKSRIRTLAKRSSNTCTRNNRWATSKYQDERKCTEKQRKETSMLYWKTWSSVKSFVKGIVNLWKITFSYEFSVILNNSNKNL